MPDPERAQARVNDFTVKFANVNGTGSASANALIMKSIFRMGVPVVGKNFFPSNIQGLPTWYEIRVTAEGWRARSGRVDVMVAMNPETYARDLRELSPGGWLVYDSTWPRPALLSRPDVTLIGVPLAQLCQENFEGARARILMKNIMYAGVMAALLDLDLEVMRALLAESYAKKPALVEANMKAIKLGYDHARANFACPLPAHVGRLDRTRGHVMMEGNTAAALGCVYAGATVGAWYPITPSTSLMDAFKAFCTRYRVDPETGRNNYVIIQAEDELAAIGAVIGASWNGARAFTPTSGPGISLMNEFIGLAYYAEIPAVLFDVQRVGPSTGLPTRTQQGDILSTAVLSHGDTRHPLLFPSSPEECFTMMSDAFDLAEYFQTPVFVMTDLDLGMNNWMSDPFPYPDQPIRRGKVLSAEDLDRLGGFARYKDVDGDGVGYRTLPGTAHRAAAYFTRGSGHDEEAKYSERPADYIRTVDRLARKFETMKRRVPPPEVRLGANASIGIVSYGTSRYAAEESRDQLRREYEIESSLLRLRAYPFTGELTDFIESHARVYVVDQNRDGQMHQLMRLDLAPELAGKLRGVRYYGGLPIDARTITEEIARQEGL